MAKNNEKNFDGVHCPFGGTKMIWGSDFMASETGHLDPETPLENDVIVKYYSCPECNASAEFVQNMEE